MQHIVPSFAAKHSVGDWDTYGTYDMRRHTEIDHLAAQGRIQIVAVNVN